MAVSYGSSDPRRAGETSVEVSVEGWVDAVVKAVLGNANVYGVENSP